MEGKICIKCKDFKPLSDYPKDKARKDGRHGRCSECAKEANNIRSRNQNKPQRKPKTINHTPEINEWLQNNYQQLVINCRKVCKNGYKFWGEDLLPFIIQEFLEKSTEYQLKVLADGKVEHWITNAMSFQLKSSTSPFYLKYRAQLINERSDGLVDIAEEKYDSKEEILKCIEDTINKMDSPNKELATDILLLGHPVCKAANKLNINNYNKYKRIEQIKKDISNCCSRYL